MRNEPDPEARAIINEYTAAHDPMPADPAEDVLAETAVVRVLEQVEEVPVDWFWHPWLARGKVAMFDGDPGEGKTAVALDLVARASRGHSMPEEGIGQEPMHCMLFMAEDDANDTIKPRLRVAGADMSMVSFFECLRGADGSERLPLLPEDGAHYRRAIEASKAGLVVIDPLFSFLGAGIDMYKDSSMRRALWPLVQIGRELDTMFLLLRHLNKGGGEKALYRGSGSIAVIASARVGWLAATDPDDETKQVLAMSKNNLVPKPRPAFSYGLVDEDSIVRVSWLGRSKHKADELLATEDGEEAGAKREAGQFLEEALAAGPVKAAQVTAEAQQNGITSRTLRRARRSLGVQAHHFGHPGEKQYWVWELPPPKVATTPPRCPPTPDLAPLGQTTEPTTDSSTTYPKGATSRASGHLGGGSTLPKAGEDGWELIK